MSSGQPRRPLAPDLPWDSSAGRQVHVRRANGPMRPTRRLPLSVATPVRPGASSVACLTCISCTI